MRAVGVWLGMALCATVLGAEPGQGVSTEGARFGEWREQRYEDVEDDGGSRVVSRSTASPDPVEAALLPYGNWYDDRDHGRVWRPQVSTTWRPYADGAWADSPWGWMWTSSEAWAWTFHYGSWTWTDAYGWVWIPGNTWGPAWVRWFWADGFVGWTPFPRAGALTLEQFVFVRERDFSASHVRTVAMSPRNLPPRVQDGFLNGGAALQRAPDPEQMGRLASQPMQRIAEKPLASLAPWERGSTAAPGASAVERVAEPDPDRALAVRHEPAPGWVTGGSVRAAASASRPGGWTRARPDATAH